MDWIYVTDSLPEDDEMVIITRADDNWEFKWTYVGWYSHEGNVWIVANEVVHDVKAWMPFPKPAEQI